MNAVFKETAPLRIAAAGLEHDEIYRAPDRLRGHDGAELAAIAERSGRLRMAAAGRYRVPVYPRLARLLAETAVDAVLVATPNGEKAAVIDEALRAGKHVIAHAPLAITPVHCDGVAEAQASSGGGVVLLLPLRFTPAYADLRAALARGTLGEITQAVIINSQQVTATPRTQAFFATKTHGGILTNLAVHDLDALRWLGGDLTVAYAATRRMGKTGHPDFEDAGLVRGRLADGGEAVVVCNWLAPEAAAPFHELNIVGTEGTAWISGGKLRLWGGAPPEIPPGGAGRAGYTALGPLLAPMPAGQADDEAVAAMLDAALTSLGDDGLRAAATADALETTRAAVEAQAMAWRESSP